ncbi:poly-gamma-glutamate biosynthesis protein PgsC [[Clostridium] aminophilum]|uniref:Poly-gamma-glutamate biosynthesis protein PgsC/CapC n=1 Tax=[Clostridium] aminophilum TaxID=1526 RepID=A0A1I6KEZ8_9FIRM|nr:poly-gamma-glutamate biosynthesis protein PgsC [[Clostridium] aminophilum]MDD6196401.1 poly-gamma-glutamate biosynthesis protein PgsC [[Clostridium] aminophilum]SFR89783.1 poly-gamma-glutamate biosynthesis protein PgsC/CapC [[Clostridium] aminophilum]
MNETLLIGIIFALIFTEFTDLSPGGVIVPAYFALYLTSPVRILTTVAAALVTMLIVSFLSRYMILYGRRRYAVFLISGVLLKVLMSALIGGTALSIGSLIPGILGREMERQHILPTLLSLAVVTLATYFVILLLR